LIGLLQIFGVILIVVIAMIYSREPTVVDVAEPALGSLAEDSAPPPVVAIFRPERSVNRHTVVATGTVAVRNYVAMTPQVTGRVASISPSLRPGGRFMAGQTLLVIERNDFELAVAQAQADIAIAESRLKLQEAESDVAVANYAILNPGKRAPPLVAKTPQIEQAKAQLAGARARADVAALSLARTTFSLPFAGRIIENTAEVGQFLSVGQSFGRAFAADAIEATVPIAPDELGQLAPVIGRRAIVRAGGIEMAAAVERVAAELDERTRFSKLYLALEGDVALPPGSFADIEIEGPPLPDTFVLPVATLQVNSHLWVIFDGALRRVDPTIRGMTERGVIVDAFDSGDGVVVGSVPGGREGLMVQIAGGSS
jgi:RND family efflux transporter MFP subunit